MSTTARLTTLGTNLFCSFLLAALNDAISVHGFFWLLFTFFRKV
ncbi:hypothetical protein [Chromobacterium sp. Panama]|nr:hypothetical protein [Chromobacterium sp. Panama]